MQRASRPSSSAKVLNANSCSSLVGSRCVTPSDHTEVVPIAVGVGGLFAMMVDKPDREDGEIEKCRDAALLRALTTPYKW